MLAAVTALAWGHCFVVRSSEGSSEGSHCVAVGCGRVSLRIPFPLHFPSFCSGSLWCSPRDIWKLRLQIWPGDWVWCIPRHLKGTPQSLVSDEFEYLSRIGSVSFSWFCLMCSFPFGIPMFFQKVLIPFHEFKCGLLLQHTQASASRQSSLILELIC